uniref:SET domain containing 4 n=1 Tax=Eptatretus burgeri TaxID=7764 RepID=A0A8C4NA09_EPTBU
MVVVYPCSTLFFFFKMLNSIDEVVRSRMGRTSRRRRKKRQKERSSRSLSHLEPYVNLARWMRKQGFTGAPLCPTTFVGTGRGLAATKTIKSNDLLVALPKRFLITADTVLQSYLGDYIVRSKLHLTPLQAVCIFLVSELWFSHTSVEPQKITPCLDSVIPDLMHYNFNSFFDTPSICSQKDSTGASRPLQAGFWKPYLFVLPNSYSCPAFFTQQLCDTLPPVLSHHATEQTSFVQVAFRSAWPFITSIQPLFTRPVSSIFTFRAFLWAWGTVNTRSVYMQPHPAPLLTGGTTGDFALAPLLDLLNHSPTAQVAAGYNEQRGCYEVRTLSPCERWKQAFIAYGDHSNHQLLLEYGFVTSPNPYSLLPLHAEDELAVFVANRLEKSMQKNLMALVERGLDRDMTIGAGGLSWNLQVVLRALALKPHHRISFGDVVVGRSVPTSMQAMATKLALQLCEQLVNDRRQRLAKVPHGERRHEATNSVITLLTEELEILQQCLSLPNVGVQNSL